MIEEPDWPRNERGGRLGTLSLHHPFQGRHGSGVPDYNEQGPRAVSADPDRFRLKEPGSGVGLAGPTAVRERKR
jgi:hypothetical protein